MQVHDPISLTRKLAAYSLDYTRLCHDVYGWTPRNWQAEILLNPRSNHLLCTHRQAGKTEAVAGLSASIALDPCRPATTSLILSTGRDHASYIMRRITTNLVAAEIQGLCEIKEKSKHHIALDDGSRVFSVASTETATRGWAVSGVLLLDECAFIPDEIISAVMPTVAAAGGSTVLLSTPNGKIGMFSDIYHGNDATWRRVTVKASDPGCPLTDDFLCQQLTVLGKARYQQEYECSFVDSDTAAFDYDSIKAAFETLPLSPDTPEPAAVHTDNPFSGMVM